MDKSMGPNQPLSWGNWPNPDWRGGWITTTQLFRQISFQVPFKFFFFSYTSEDSHTGNNNSLISWKISFLHCSAFRQVVRASQGKLTAAPAKSRLLLEPQSSLNLLSLFSERALEWGVAITREWERKSNNGKSHWKLMAWGNTLKILLRNWLEEMGVIWRRTFVYQENSFSQEDLTFHPRWPHCDFSSQMKNIELTACFTSYF